MIRALLVVLLLAGCAGRQTAALVDDPGRLPQSAQVAGVPFFPQADNACGPASLAMALVWAGRAASPDHMSTLAYTPGREGSLAVDMLGAARREGMLAVPVHGLAAVLAELAAGHPVVVFQNLGLAIEPLWHFAVATGYDLRRREIILHSGLDPDLRLDLDTFEHTWERAGGWAVVMMPPDRLPATASEPDAVVAATGLERAGRAPAAARAFAAILVRWPGSLAAAIGLGNVRYIQADMAGAEEAFRQAAQNHPGSAAAWNNLAHVLLERGRRDEALAAATRAVEIGGGDGVYGDTWRAAVNAPSANDRHP